MLSPVTNTAATVGQGTDSQAASAPTSVAGGSPKPPYSPRYSRCWLGTVAPAVTRRLGAAAVTARAAKGAVDEAVEAAEVGAVGAVVVDGKCAADPTSCLGSPRCVVVGAPGVVAGYSEFRITA
jgi:hypothetical protein